MTATDMDRQSGSGDTIPDLFESAFSEDRESASEWNLPRGSHSCGYKHHVLLGYAEGHRPLWIL
jgi:hypothetical protein